MNVSGRRILKTTAAVVGISALGALGTGTAFAATPADLGGAPTSHGTSTADAAGLSSPTSSTDDLHSFSAPKMDTHVAEPTYRYNDDDSDYNDDNDNDNNRSNNRYDNDNNYRYNNSDYNDGYYSNGRYHYRNNDDDGLLGGGLLGGNN